MPAERRLAVLAACILLAICGLVSVAGFASAIGMKPVEELNDGPSSKLLAGRIGSTLTGRARKHLPVTFGCVQVRSAVADGSDRMRRRPVVRLLITDRARLGAARRLVARTVAETARSIGKRFFDRLPVTKVLVVDRRYRDRIANRIFHRLGAEAGGWIGVPGVGMLASPALGADYSDLPFCRQITFKLRPEHTPEQRRWVYEAQRRYGADRIEVLVMTGSEPVVPLRGPR